MDSNLISLWFNPMFFAFNWISFRGSTRFQSEVCRCGWQKESGGESHRRNYYQHQYTRSTIVASNTATPNFFQHNRQKIKILFACCAILVRLASRNVRMLFSNYISLSCFGKTCALRRARATILATMRRLCKATHKINLPTQHGSKTWHSVGQQIVGKYAKL